MATNPKDPSELLNEQYALTESYCNAETALRNAILSGQPIDAALRHQQEALRSLQIHFQALRQIESMESAGVWRDHVQRTRRILQSVTPEYHANGLPKPTNDDGQSKETVLLALSTLRASIHSVKDTLS